MNIKYEGESISSAVVFAYKTKIDEFHPNYDIKKQCNNFMQLYAEIMFLIDKVRMEEIEKLDDQYIKTTSIDILNQKYILIGDYINSFLKEPISNQNDKQALSMCLLILYASFFLIGSNYINLHAITSKNIYLKEIQKMKQQQIYIHANTYHKTLTSYLINTTNPFEDLTTFISLLDY